LVRQPTERLSRAIRWGTCRRTCAEAVETTTVGGMIVGMIARALGVAVVDEIATVGAGAGETTGTRREGRADAEAAARASPCSSRGDRARASKR